MTDQPLKKGKANNFLPGSALVMTPIEFAAEAGEIPFTIDDDFRVLIKSPHSKDVVYDKTTDPALLLVPIDGGVRLELTIPGKTTAGLNNENWLLIERGPAGNAVPWIWLPLSEETAGGGCRSC